MCMQTYILRRLGVKTRIFHLGDYRRATVGAGQDLPEDYFFINGKWVFPTTYVTLYVLSALMQIFIDARRFLFFNICFIVS